MFWKTDKANGMKITTPGIYVEFPTADYFADPCESPSLTQSVAKIIIDRSAKHGWLQHPRLNPDFEVNDETKFDLGNVAHFILIGRGKEVVSIDADDWRTKAAKEAREQHKAEGRLAVLARQFDQASEMADAARKQLAQTKHADAFSIGHGEVVVAWRNGDMWLRSMLDWLVSTTRPYDFKSTDMSCAPHAVEDRPSLMGWDLQAAFHEAGLDAVDPDNAGRRKFHYVAQETCKPYALTVVEIGEADLTMGRKKLAMATDIWVQCMRSGQWPAYAAETVISRPRGWTETRFLEREVEHHERRARNPEPMLTDLAGG